MKNYRASFSLLAIFILIILFLEVTFKARLLYFEFRFQDLLNMDFLRNILFTLSYGLFVLAFIKLFKTKTVRNLFFVFSILLVVLYFSQDIYFLISNNFYSFAISGEITKGFTFFYRLPQSLMWTHAFYLVPIIFAFFLIRAEKDDKINLFNIRYQSYKQPFIYLVVAFVILFASIQTINTEKDDSDNFSFSDYDLYIDPVVPHTAMRKFGVITYARIDLQNAFRPYEDTTITSDSIHDFFAERPEHEPNIMTDIFEDKNFIMIMAEALDTYAIHPKLTPNIYKLLETSYTFDNFYAPLYYRNTADTEFMVQTGFYPNKSVQLSMDRYMDNYFPNTLPKLFKDQGYNTAAFHNFSDHFYPRAEFHPQTLGYDTYYGPDELGLEEPLPEDRDVSGHYWHSDLEMFEKGLPHIINEDRFYAYFLTVTGHLPYDDDRHDLALKHYPTIEEILIEEGLEDIDESLKYYHASQWELDLAIGYLVEALKDAGKYDDTVIMIYGDHYAYGLDQDVIWEYDTVKDDRSLLNIHNVPLIISNPNITPEMHSPFFSTIDLTPTISNMFGLDLDYQQIIGQDAFNSYDNTIILSSSSFINKSYYYNVKEDLFFFESDDMTEDQMRALIGEVLYLYRINNYILENDYFQTENPGFANMLEGLID